LRPLPQPPKFLWPGLSSPRLEDFKLMIERMTPGVKVHIPTMFQPVELIELL
jgi:hypothetical protein